MDRKRRYGSILNDDRRKIDMSNKAKDTCAAGLVDRVFGDGCGWVTSAAGTNLPSGAAVVALHVLESSRPRR
jgi:hypothetical protein